MDPMAASRTGESDPKIHSQEEGRALSRSAEVIVDLESIRRTLSETVARETVKDPIADTDFNLSPTAPHYLPADTVPVSGDLWHRDQL